MDKPDVLPGTLLSALRPHHWVKNLLVFVPILTAQRWDEAMLWVHGGVTFVAFSLCSSAVYLANDLLDIEDDRAHPIKRHRPLASGKLRPRHAIMMAALLAAFAFSLSALSGVGRVLAVYIAGALAYSAWLKMLPVVDLLALVAFYGLRLLAGGEATGIPVSGWLLAYGGCVFASLALAKRGSELGGAVAGDLPLPQRRGYRPEHRRMLTALGIAAAIGSAVILMFYLRDGPARELYTRPEWLLPVGAIVLAWLLRVWWFAVKGRLHSDPVVFALRDVVSLMSGCGVLVLLWLAAG